MIGFGIVVVLNGYGMQANKNIPDTVGDIDTTSIY